MKIKKIHIIPRPSKIKIFYSYVYKNKTIFRKIKKYNSEVHFYTHFKAYCPICNERLKIKLYLFNENKFNFHTETKNNIVFKCKNCFRCKLWNDGDFPSSEIYFFYKNVAFLFEMERDGKFHNALYKITLNSIDYKNIGKLLALI